MAPDLFGRPSKELDAPGKEPEPSADGMARIWKALPFKKDKRSGYPALRDALIRVAKSRVCSMDDAESYMLERVLLLQKYAGPYLAKRSAAGLDSGKVKYPQGYFNGDHFEEDEHTLRLTFGVPGHVETAERVQAEDQRQKLADAEAKRRARIDNDHQTEVISSMDPDDRAKIVLEYLDARRESGKPIAGIIRDSIEQHGLKSPHVWCWAVETGRVPAPDYTQRKDLSNGSKEEVQVRR